MVTCRIKGHRRDIPAAILCPRNNGTVVESVRWSVMKRQTSMFELVAGALFALGAIAFVVGGGGFGGKKVVDGDEDLPPVAQGAAPAPQGGTLHAQNR